MTDIRESVLSAIGNTPVVRLRKLGGTDSAEIVVKLEYYNPTGSYKDRMALAMIEGAEGRGALTPGMRVIEYTGGRYFRRRLHRTQCRRRSADRARARPGPHRCHGRRGHRPEVSGGGTCSKHSASVGPPPRRPNSCAARRCRRGGGPTLAGRNSPSLYSLS